MNETEKMFNDMRSMAAYKKKKSRTKSLELMLDALRNSHNGMIQTKIIMRVNLLTNSFIRMRDDCLKNKLIRVREGKSHGQATVFYHITSEGFSKLAELQGASS